MKSFCKEIARRLFYFRKKCNEKSYTDGGVFNCKKLKVECEWGLFEKKIC